jgi:tetratricopeptide (TPR) repeat protein
VNRPAYLEEITALWRRGDLDAMVAACREKIEQLSSNPNSPPSEIATLHQCLARAYSDLGDYFADIRELERALQLHRTESAIPRDEIIACLGNLGLAFLWTGRPAEAEERLFEALVLLDHMPEPEQFGRGFVFQDLALIHSQQQELKAAEKLQLQAITLHMRYFGPGSPALAHAIGNLSCVYEKQGRTSAADRAMDKAMGFLCLANETSDVNFAIMLSIRGLQLKARGRVEEARAFQSEALSILERIRKPGHFLLERVKHRLAQLDEPLAQTAG